MKIWAISGFLGLATDWNHLKMPDLQGVNPLDFSLDSFEAWACAFNQSISNDTSEKAILMGYSLGGRLALHALLAQPHLWEAAIIISAHPGLKTEQEKKQRLINDQKWAKHFENVEWQELMQQWNQQEIFKHGSVTFQRKEHDYCRQKLSKVLDRFSLGRQNSLYQLIESQTLPILWITGASDTRFNQLAKELQFSHPLSKKISVPKAYHRLPWTHQKSLGKEIRSLTNSLQI